MTNCQWRTGSFEVSLRIFRGELSVANCQPCLRCAPGTSGPACHCGTLVAPLLALLLALLWLFFGTSGSPCVALLWHFWWSAAWSSKTQQPGGQQPGVQQLNSLDEVALLRMQIGRATRICACRQRRASCTSTCILHFGSLSTATTCLFVGPATQCIRGVLDHRMAAAFCTRRRRRPVLVPGCIRLDPRPGVSILHGQRP